VIGLTGARVELGGAPVLAGVDLRVADGEWVAVVGPNGAGKSTLLRLVAGLVRGAADLVLDGRRAAELSRRERARLVALVVQAPTIPEGITVADYALLGRNPHIRPFGVEGAADLAAAHDALAHLDLLDLAGRVVATLSGGERQRVLLARALAQGAPILLLDEPTSALDVGHQQQVLELVDRLRRDHGLTVVTTMHDLTLAGQYADRLVLLDRGRVAVEGTAAEVVTEATMARFYGARVRIVDDGGRPVVLPVRSPS
jgi:iron complex transport system ATP-binding protein